jgi:hypothetical protein
MARGAPGGGLSERLNQVWGGRKVFFFEKKNQKTFACLGAGWGEQRHGGFSRDWNPHIFP